MSTITHTLSNNDLLLINAALTAFEQPAPKVIDGKETRQPYDLSDKAKLAVLRNLKRIKPVIEEITNLRDDLKTTYNPRSVRQAELPEDKAQEWETEHNKLMRTKRDGLKFHSAKLSEFNLSKNTTLPLSVISTLIGTVIEDDGTQDGLDDDTKE